MAHVHQSVVKSVGLGARRKVQHAGHLLDQHKACMAGERAGELEEIREIRGESERRGNRGEGESKAGKGGA